MGCHLLAWAGLISALAQRRALTRPSRCSFQLFSRLPPASRSVCPPLLPQSLMQASVSSYVAVIACANCAGPRLLRGQPSRQALSGGQKSHAFPHCRSSFEPGVFACITPRSASAAPPMSFPPVARKPLCQHQPRPYPL